MSEADETGLSMRAVTRLTGITEHVLRAWERRYAIVIPARTEGGTRSYSDQDVARLRLVKYAVDHGHSIGKVAKMSGGDLAAIRAAGEESGASVEPLVERVLKGDAAGLERELRVMADWIGPVRWAYEVAGPFSVAIGDAWHAGRLRLAQEHMATACVARITESILLRLSAEREKKDASGLPQIVLTTPPDELHVLGLQLAALVAASRGFPVTLLGAQTPADALAEFVASLEDAIAVVGVMALARAATQSYLRKLRKLLPESRSIYAGGASIVGIKLPYGVTPIADLASFESLLDALEAKRPRGGRA